MKAARCRDCGRAIKLQEWLPGSTHLWAPRYCPSCLRRRERESWSGPADMAVMSTSTVSTVEKTNE